MSAGTVGNRVRPVRGAPASAEPRDDIELSELVGLCRTAFGKRPIEEAAGSVAEGAAALVRAARVSVVMISYGEMLLISAQRGRPWTQRWHGETADAERLARRLSDGAEAIVLTAPGEPDRDLWCQLFGAPCAPSDVVTAFPFASHVAGGRAGGLIVAANEVYRRQDTRRAALEVIARQIELALRAARLAEAQQDQMVGLARMVVGLRQQSQAHVTELLELQTSLARGTIAETQALVAGYHAPTGVRAWRLASPIVVGLLLGEMSVAHERGVKLRVSAHSSLEVVPSSLGDLGLVSVLSNLISNAFDAVESLPASRRRVSVLVKQRAGRTTIRVRDWGVGLAAHRERDVLRGGYSTKAPGRGTGLALVNRLVTAAGGEVDLARCDVGTQVTVTVPDE